MFRKYNHVVRLDNDEVEGLIDADEVTVSYKIDGTNSSIWYDSKSGEVKTGSRTRELTTDNDNGGFCAWLLNENTPETAFLKKFVTDHQNLIVYGEWLGTVKFLGAIKDYSRDALKHLWVFDIYDRETGSYLPEGEWRALLSNEWAKDNPTDDEYPYYIPYLTVENPTKEKLVEVARNNHFLLESADHPGEGIVIRRHGYTNPYGRYEIGKIVLDEYRQDKSRKKKIPIKREGIEAGIVTEFVTDAECSKAVAKIETLVDAPFDKKNKSHVGRYMNEVWVGAILDEMASICKKWKNPILDMAVLKAETTNKARTYLFGE